MTALMLGLRGVHAMEIVDALKANAMMSSGGLTLIDVRNGRERETQGIPKGSIWLEWQGPEQSVAFLQAVTAQFPDKDAPLAFICAVGHRSGQAARLVETAGYRRVLDVAEGMNGSVMGPGWKLWGLPLDAR